MKSFSLKTSALLSGLGHVGLAGGVFVALNGPNTEQNPRNLTPLPVEFSVLATSKSASPRSTLGQTKGTSKSASAPKVTRSSQHQVRRPAPIAPPVYQESLQPPVPEENQTAPATQPSYTLGSPECPHPRYPKEARHRGLSGRVVVRLHVSKDGSVDAADILQSSGHAILDEAACETLRMWRLQPATHRGIASTSTVDIPIRFELVTP